MLILVGSLFTIAFTFVIALLCGEVLFFIDPLSLYAIILPLIFFLVVSKSGKVLGGYMKTSFKKNPEYSAAALTHIAAAAKSAVKFTLATGWFGFFAGLVSTLAKVNDPSAVGPSLAVTIISIFYAIAIGYFVFFPVQAWAENKIMSLKNQ